MRLNFFLYQKGDSRNYYMLKKKKLVPIKILPAILNTGTKGTPQSRIFCLLLTFRSTSPGSQSSLISSGGTKSESKKSILSKAKSSELERQKERAQKNKEMEFGYDGLAKTHPRDSSESIRTARYSYFLLIHFSSIFLFIFRYLFD